MKKLILIAASVFSFTAFADLKPMATQGQEADVAAVAASIFSVKNFQIGKYAFKVTEMDSALNGDVQTTTILTVGEGGVGGAAGYDAAFLITPSQTPEILATKRVNVVKDVIVFTLIGGDGKDLVKKYRYDAKTTTLKEVP